MTGKPEHIGIQCSVASPEMTFSPHVIGTLEQTFIDANGQARTIIHEITAPSAKVYNLDDYR